MRLILSRIYSLFQEKIYPKKAIGGKKNADTVKTSSNLKKKNPEYKFQISFTKSHQILWNLHELVKRYKTKCILGKLE